MRRWWAGEDGSAAVEFLSAGVLLLLPLIYLALALAALQSAAYGAEGAAREAARSYVAETTDAAGRAAADRAVSVVFADHRLRRQPGDLTILDSGGDRVRATVSFEAPLPFLPAVFGLERLARIPVRASATMPRPTIGAP